MNQAAGYPRFLPVGDTALSVEFGDRVAPELNDAVIALDTALAASEIAGIIETVPSYRSLLVCYEPLEISLPRLIDGIGALLSHETPGRARASQGAVWNVPVIYDPPFADDLPEVAHRLGLTEDAVIAHHTGAEFLVYTVGFVPGMPYLGGLPDALRLSRREMPRPLVPAGAVMIGGIQATIVPIVLTSAWYTLGRTPLRPFAPERADPFLFRSGDHVRFRRVGSAEFADLSALDVDALLRLVRTAR